MQSTLKRTQSGMSLIEVIVSMLIIGMGLGMSVSMIQASNRYAESAENRAIALDEIQTIANSMQSNVLGGPAYVWGTPNYQAPDPNSNPPSDPYEVSKQNIPNMTLPDCNATCSNDDKLLRAAQQVAFARANADLTTWVDGLQVVLPGGQGAITRAGNLYTVTVMWRASDENDLGIAQNKASEAINLTFPL